jgi:DNA-binding transcriptional MerR regulator
VTPSEADVGRRTDDVSSSEDRSLEEGSLPRFTVRAVAQRLGMPTATLRSWSQRYGVGPGSHRPGQHRLYSEADVAVLEHMHVLVGQGATPRTAARAALEQAMPASADAAELLDAALQLDAAAVSHALDTHIRHHGVIDAWEHLIRPVFAAVEARQKESAGCIDVEHVLSWTAARSLHRITTPATSSPASVLLCCSPGETHTLALEALRGALSERGCPTLMLGANTPTSAVIDAVRRRSAPASVVLFAQSSANADIHAVQTIGDEGAHVVLAGPGWDHARTSIEAVWVNSLDEAVRHLLIST